MEISVNGKLFFLITLVLYSLLYCSAYSQNQKDSSYFPLAIGNQWIYESVDNSYKDTITVVDTQRVNGKLYYAVKQNSLYVYLWFRNDNGKVYIVDTIAIQLDPSNFRENILYDFSAKIGESWDVPLTSNIGIIICDYGGSIKMESKNDSIITSTGVFKNCLCFSHRVPCRDAGRTSEWFAAGIGRTAYWEITFSGMRKFYLSYSNIITGISDKNNYGLINEYRLLQNYPNPFNSLTNIEYSTGRRGNVSIILYNTLGEKIKTLENSFRNPGNYKISFDAGGLTSGVYYYQLRTGYFQETKKLVYLK